MRTLKVKIVFVVEKGLNKIAHSWVGWLDGVPGYREHCRWRRKEMKKERKTNKETDKNQSRETNRKKE